MPFPGFCSSAKALLFIPFMSAVQRLEYFLLSAISFQRNFRFPQNNFTQKSVVTWRHRNHSGVGAPRQFCRMWNLFLRKHFLLFQNLAWHLATWVKTLLSFRDTLRTREIEDPRNQVPIRRAFYTIGLITETQWTNQKAIEALSEIIKILLGE